MTGKNLFSLPVLIVLMLAVISAVMLDCVRRREAVYDGVIRAASARHGLDLLLVKAVVRRESNFRADARGSKGERGLMQVMPVVGKEYAAWRRWSALPKKGLLDPELNTEVGCWYLAKAMRRYRAFRDPVPFALAHYNAGGRNVDRWLAATRTPGNARQFIRAISYPSTRRYVRQVTRRYRLSRLLRFL